MRTLIDDSLETAKRKFFGPDDQQPTMQGGQAEKPVMDNMTIQAYAKKAFYGPMGFKEMLKDEWTGSKLGQKVPFAGAAEGIMDSLEVRWAAQRLSDRNFNWNQVVGDYDAALVRNNFDHDAAMKEVTYDRQSDIKRVEDFILRLYEADIRGVTFGGKVAQGVSILPTWMSEFAMTGGIAALGSAPAKAAMTKLLGKYGQTLAGKAAIGTVGLAGGAAARGTIGLAPRIAEDAIERRTDMQVGIREDESMAATVMKSWGDKVIESFSEETGGAIAKGGGYLLSKLPFSKKLYAAIQKLKPKITMPEFIQTISTKAGWSNLLAEYGEERVGTILRGLTGVEDYGIDEDNPLLLTAKMLKKDLEEIGVELTVLTVPGGVRMGAGYAVAGYDKIIDHRHRANFKKFMQTDEGLDFIASMTPQWADKIADTESPSRSDFEEVDITGWSAQERRDFAERLRARKAGQQAIPDTETKIDSAAENQVQTATDNAAGKVENTDVPAAQTEQPHKPLTPDGRTRLESLTAEISKLLQNNGDISHKDFVELANRVYGGSRGEGKWSISDAYDELETGVHTYLSKMTDPTVNVEQAVETLRELQKVLSRIPAQQSRSGEKASMQQFSTPPHYAYTAAWLANINKDDVVLEPSAGTGGLAIHAKNAGAKVNVNELSKRRASLLERMGFDRVTTEDAEQIHNILPENERPTVILMNPPFSRAAQRMGDKRVLGTDQRHVEAALKYLQDGGRLVAIMGAPMKEGKETNSFAKWLSEIKKQYNVVGHVIIPRGVYSKYGTNFPTRMLVIDKNGPTTDTKGGTVDSLEQLLYNLEGVKNARTHSGKPVTGITDLQADAAKGQPGPQSVRDVSHPTGSVVSPDISVEGKLGKGSGTTAVSGAVPGGLQAEGSIKTPSGHNRGRRGAVSGGDAHSAGSGGDTDRKSVGVDGGTQKPVKITDALSAEKQKRLEELKKQIAEKLKNQLNTGIDPELMMMLGEAGLLYVEAGVRTFADWSGQVVADLGDAVKPYLKSTYMYVRNSPQAAAYAKDMDKASAIEDLTEQDIDRIITGSVQEQAGPSEQVAERRQAEETKVTASGSDMLFTEYRPQKIHFKGAQKHPSALVESLAMASVEVPDNHVKLHIPQRLIEEGVLSEAQLVPIAQAEAAHQEFVDTPKGRMRRGYMDGDGTGVGKGRILAGIILNNWMQGRRKAVIISENPKLYAEAQRDWEAMGQDPKQVFLAKSGEPVKAKEGILYFTYYTLKQPASKGKLSRMAQLTQWLGEDFDGVIVFDEAHNMGNLGYGNKKPSQMALSGVELQNLSPNARVIYASATGATEVENLGFAARLGLWGDGTPFRSAADFINKVSERGVAAMELLSQSMKAMGMYIARSLAYNDGTEKGTVKYNRIEHNLSSDQRAIYNRLAEAWQIVFKNLSKALSDTNQGQDGGIAGRKRAAFFSAEQRFFNQILTAMQTPSVIRAIEQDLKDGHSAIIQLTNTMEAAQERAFARMEAQDDLEDFDLTPRDTLIDYVRKVFPVEQYEEHIDENGNLKVRPALDSNGNPILNREAVAARDKLIRDLEDIQVPDSPIDMIISHFGPELVAEVTSRKRRVISKVGEEGLKRKAVEKLGKKAREADIDHFLNGQKRILIFSEAGGTGASYHSGKNFKNQQHRHHYLLQAGWRANKAMQGLGRSHRTFQESAPTISLITTDVKGQKRFISTIARRLSQLGALVMGERGAFSRGVFTASDNLESQQAKDALRTFFEDLAAGRMEGLDIGSFQEMTGLELLDKDGVLKERTPEIEQFLNRTLALTIETQDRVFEEFEKRHQDKIDFAIANDSLDTGLETIKASKIEKISEQAVFKHDKSGAVTKHVKLGVFHKVQPITWEGLHQGDKTAGRPILKFVETENGKVYAVTDAADHTDPATGRIIPQYRLIDQKTYHFIEKYKLDSNTKGFYKVLTAETAKERWAEEVRKLPKYRKQTVHLLTGAVLPIWNKLPKEAKVRRAVTETGDEYLGLFVDNARINDVLRGLGKAEDVPHITAKEALDGVASGQLEVVLANNWRIKRVRIQGENRVEIEGADEYHKDKLDRAGVISEQIKWKTRYFIPLGKSEVLEKLNEPIVQVVELKESDPGLAVPLDVPVELDAKGQIKQVSAMEILKTAERMFGVVIRSGKVSKQNAGVYRWKPEVVRTQSRFYGDLAVMSHEIAHHLDKMTGIRRSGLSAVARKDLRELDYVPNRGQTREGFAEFLRVYLTTDQAEQIAPNFYDFFENDWLPNHPEWKKPVATVKRMIDQWRVQGSLSRGKSQISWDGKPAEPAGVPKPQIFKHKFDKAMARAYSAMKDEGHFLSRFVKEAQRRCMDINAGTNPNEMYIAFTQNGPTHSAEALENGVFKMTGQMDRIGPSMKEVLAEIKSEEYEDFVLYAYSRHSLESWARGHNPGLIKIDAQANYKKLHNARFDQAAKLLTEFNNALIWMLADAGVITPQSARNIVNSYKTYIPLKRAVESLHDAKLGGKKLLNTPDPLKRRTKDGSGRQVIDPVQTTFEYAIRFYERAAQQIVINRMVEVARKAEGMGSQMEFIRPSTKVTSFTIGEIEQQLEDLGVEVKDLIEAGDIDPAEMLYLYRPNYSGKSGMPIARVIVNGKPQLYEFDRDLYRAINGMNYFQLHPMLEYTFGTVTRSIKLGATGINLAFGQRNLIKDYLTYLAQSKAGKRAAGKALPFSPGTMSYAYIVHHINTLLGKEGNATVELWEQMGGPLSQRLGLDRRKIRAAINDIIADSTKRRMWNAAKNPIEAARDLIGVTEVGPRLAEFQAILEKHGYSEDKLQELLKQGKRPPIEVLTEAINAANDVTTNFKRQGWVGKYLNRMIPYFNAPLEGTDKYIRTWRDDPKRALIYTLSSAAVTVAYWAMVKDDDWYKEAPAWLKYGFRTIPMNGKPVVRIPRAHLWDLTFSTGLEALLNSMYDDDPQAVKQWLRELYGETGMPSAWHDLLPSGAKQLYEVAANQDIFRDRPIVTDKLKRLKPEDQYTPYNLALSKWMGRQLGLSPAKIEHFINGVTGNLYVNTVGLWEGKAKLKGFEVRRDYSESMDRFYAELVKAEQEYNSAKKADKATLELYDRNRTLQEYAALISDIRNTVADISLRDPRFEQAEKYTVGLARHALNKPELERYPNPLKVGELPAPVRALVEDYLGSKLYLMTNPVVTRHIGESVSKFKERQAERQQSIARSLELMKRLEMSEERAIELLRKEAKSRGLRPEIYINGNLSAYGQRYQKIKREL